MMRPVKLFIPFFLAASITACGGGSSDDDTVAGENQAPSASDIDVTFNWASQDESLSIDVIAEANDPDGDELIVTSIGDAESGTTSIVESAIVYQPNEGFFGVDTFTYTISDGALEAEATIELEVVSEIAISGRVVDSPIANASVTITVDGEDFTVEADDEGYYEIPTTIRSLDNDEVVRITAKGSADNGQSHVTLSSMLTSAARLLNYANDNFSITREQLNDVNVTHVSTARDILVRRAAAEKSVTDANIGDFGNTIDPQLLIQMAAVTKLIIDNENFDLPTGYDSIEDFLNNEDSYNEFVEVASDGGDASPLNQAIEETLADPEIMPELKAEDLYGRYVEVVRAPAFLKPDANLAWDITEDGIAWFNGNMNFENRLTYSLAGNRIIPDRNDVIMERSPSAWLHLSEEAFNGDQEAIDAWIDYNDWSFFQGNQVERFTTSGMSNAQVISHNDNELIIRYERVNKREPFIFEHEGVEYQVDASTSTYEVDARLVKVDVFKKSELVFDLDTNTTWLLPPIYPHDISFLTSHVYDFASDNTYSLRLQEALLEDKNLVEADFSGSWELSEDKRQLTLTSGGGYSLRLTRHRDEADYHSVVAEYLEDDAVRSTKLSYGLAMPKTIDMSTIDEVIGSNKLFNSIVNFRAAKYWNEENTLRIHSFMFDFSSDGSGEQLEGLCKGELWWTNPPVCDEPMTIDPETTSEMTWEFGNNEDFDTLFVFNRLANKSPYDSYRHWVPLGVSEYNIMSVLEWDIQKYTDQGFSDEYYIIMPRFNHYQLAERPETYNGSTAQQLQSMGTEISADPAFNYGYQIINPQNNERPVSTRH